MYHCTLYAGICILRLSDGKKINETNILNNLFLCPNGHFPGEPGLAGFY